MIPIVEFFNQQNNIVRAALIVGVSIVLATLFTVSEKLFTKVFFKKTKTKLDDIIVERTRGPIWLLILLIGTKIAITQLDLTTNVPALLLKSAIILIITFIIVRVADALIDVIGKKITETTESSIDDELLPLFHGFSKAVMWIIGALVVMSAWGIEIAPFLASLGIAGVAIGFALQDSLKNVFGGISLLLDKTFKKGDVIKTESGINGTVYDIGLRSTKIKTWDNQIVSIPNGSLSVASIENWVQPDLSVRVTIKFGVQYGTGIDKVKKIVLDIIKKDEDISNEPAPVIFFVDMAESALMFTTYFFVNELSKKMPTEDRIRTEIYNALNKAKIGIPYPTRIIHIKK